MLYPHSPLETDHGSHRKNFAQAAKGWCSQQTFAHHGVHCKFRHPHAERLGEFGVIVHRTEGEKKLKSTDHKLRGRSRTKGKADNVVDAQAFNCMMTGARFDRWISGTVASGSCSYAC